MQVSCAQCAFTTTIDAALLPADGMLGICPRCRSHIPLGAWEPAEAKPAAAPLPLQPEAAEEQLPPEGWVSVINILALLFIVDSTLSLLSRVPGLPAVFWSASEVPFHERAKLLYDALMAAGLFVAAIGLMARKEWGRLLSLWLLGLGLAEGLYVLVYQHFAIAELEQNLHEGFQELRGGQKASLVGCLLYAYFIVRLCRRTVKARFR